MSTHTSQKIDQKEYLKKYLSGGKNKKKKKDKKHKKSKDPPGGIKVTIIDDDLVDMDNGVKIDEELLLTGEDAPQIVGEYTEDIHNAVKNIPKWKSIVIKDEDDADEDKPLKEEDLWGRKASEIKIKQEIQVKREKLSPDTSPPRKKEKKKRSKRSPSNSPSPKRNKSPSRRKRSVSPNKSPQRKSVRSPQRMARARGRDRSRSADNSPPRTSRFSEKVDQSPTRKGRRSPDQSPPRRRKERSQSPTRRRRNSDQSPARRRDRRSPEQQSPQRRTRESDQSPARKNKSSYNNEKVKRQTPPRLPARVSIDSDQSPPRKPRKSPDQSPTRRRRNYDQSPPRRGRRPPTDQSPPRRRRTSDQSPPRKGESRRESPATRTIKREKTSMDLSPQRRRRTSDQSPPRKDKSRRESPATRTIKREKTSMDLSPQRKNKHKSPSPPPPQRKSRWEQPASRYSNSPPPTHKPKVTKTLDGKRAGLQDAQALKTESVDRRRQEDLLFEKMSSDLSGRHAEVRVRNTGRKGRRAREALEEDPEERRLKEERGQKRKEHYERLGKGLKQLEDHKNRQAEMEYEASKPLARHANDADLEQFLKDQERAEDPMLNYMRQKRKEKEQDSNEPKKPVYEGPCPENRFGIRPGYRWDGVDRSNGYEKKWFDKQNERKARQIEAYQYSVEDM